MPLTVGWPDMAARLVLSVLAGALIGWNRGEHGHPAGLRTTLLVCLAASVSMIEANLLLDTSGKPGESLLRMDVMRLPLGILSGMGFIGAGAILRRGDVVLGVTTAATLWFVTVIGLCLGSGNLAFGVIAAVLGYLVLSALKKLEDFLPAERRATLELTLVDDADVKEALSADLAANGFHLTERACDCRSETRQRHYRFELRWRAPVGNAGPSELLGGYASRPGVVELSWRIGTL